MLCRYIALRCLPNMTSEMQTCYNFVLIFLLFHTISVVKIRLSRYILPGSNTCRKKNTKSLQTPENSLCLVLDVLKLKSKTSFSIYRQAVSAFEPLT